MIIIIIIIMTLGFPAGSAVKNSPAIVGDSSLILRSGRSPGEGNGNPLQYACLENPMERGAWGVTVHGITKGGTQRSDWTTANDCH